MGCQADFAPYFSLAGFDYPNFLWMPHRLEISVFPQAPF
jgi:hypothetical protein